MQQFSADVCEEDNCKPLPQNVFFFFVTAWQIYNLLVVGKYISENVLHDKFMSSTFYI